ncbi:hypothetical protein HPB49_015975 [Dermacentor silvarum]|uniref:Uncharacterized protein n=1 Tax=Dermacentor silvarum TaxID=543639 RepID=A0ACB8CYF6_DERSI|nr:hypothetical protein HPB49_015975 [Dermacentor silvarum]
MTGLPRCIPLPALKNCGALGDIADLIPTHEFTHVTRLKSTNAGRATLAKIGHDMSNLPALPRISPPWDYIPIADPKPLPKNMGQKQPARRQAHAKRHEKYRNQQLEGNDYTRAGAIQSRWTLLSDDQRMSQCSQWRGQI